jgi:hypothetical protein
MRQGVRVRATTVGRSRSRGADSILRHNPIQSFGTTMIDAWPIQPATSAKITTTPTLLALRAPPALRRCLAHARERCHGARRPLVAPLRKRSLAVPVP